MSLVEGTLKSLVGGTLTIWVVGMWTTRVEGLAKLKDELESSDAMVACEGLELIDRFYEKAHQSYERVPPRILLHEGKSEVLLPFKKQNLASQRSKGMQ
ncbi:uncharacterized protein G2W53_026115 [Senna tora]|uniref:Uncharacterized protein n=1 Tax=Senna tora TaxID=362788 RepID=A0A834TGW8_9FABA|nr:uncharacterized protein G2W53_026115 [Senna tora]